MIIITCDNMLYFQDNQLDTFSTMDYCSCLKIHMALVELRHVFSYLNLNQEMPDNKCLFSEKKKVPWNLLIGFSFKSPLFMDTVKKGSFFVTEGSKFVWDSNFCRALENNPQNLQKLRPRKSHTTLQG